MHQTCKHIPLTSRNVSTTMLSSSAAKMLCVTLQLKPQHLYSKSVLNGECQCLSPFSFVSEGVKACVKSTTPDDSGSCVTSGCYKIGCTGFINTAADISQIIFSVVNMLYHTVTNDLPKTHCHYGSNQHQQVVKNSFYFSIYQKFFTLAAFSLDDQHYNFSV